MGIQITQDFSSQIDGINDLLDDIKHMGVGNTNDIFTIGTPGEVGFGVAACRSDTLPEGFKPLYGCYNPMSSNYGNYMDSNGSILVYIPKHYYKWVGNDIYFADDNTDSSFVLDRAFINNGTEKDGVFVYKYCGSNNNGILVSQRYADPVSTSTDHNPIGNLNNSPTTTCGGVYQAVKTAGNDYFVTTIFIYSMLARLAYAQGKYSTNTVACAYIDVNPKMPKGCLINAFHDVNDTSVTYTPSGYVNCGLTGSGTPFAKTTHNGQDCGIADLNGNMWEVASGLITGLSTPTPADFLVLNEDTDITAIVDDSTTTGTGAYDTNLYTNLDLTGLIPSDETGIWVYYGNGTNPVFGMSTDSTSNIYKRTSCGLPNNDGVSSSGTIEFGNDGLYRYLQSELCEFVGGYWGASSYAGVFAVALYGYRAGSNSNVSVRASIYPK